MNNPPPAAAAPANEYERLMTLLPEDMREECKKRLTGSGLSFDHPVFQLLADCFEKRPVEDKSGIPDFIGEATLHAQRSKELLDDFQKIPSAILAQIEPQLLGLVSGLNAPVEKLETAAASLDRTVRTLPVLLFPKEPILEPRPETGRLKIAWWETKKFYRQNFEPFLAQRQPWIVIGSICVSLTVIVLATGTSRLSQSLNESYQQRLTHLEADSVENTIALNRLVAAGINLKVEKSRDGTSYFLILGGAQKAAQPVNSPEGLAVEVWP